MTTTRIRSKQVYPVAAGVLAGLLAFLAGCAAPSERPRQHDAPAARPGVAPEIWACEPADGDWRCERRRGRYP